MATTLRSQVCETAGPEGMHFKLWLEEYRDIFGFDEDMVQPHLRPRPDDRPIRPFDVNGMLERLAGHRLGPHPGVQRFPNEVQWGHGPGAVRVEVGMQLTAYVERLVYDLEGRPVWVTKKVYKINTEEYNRFPDSVADALWDDAQKVHTEGLEGADKAYSTDALAELIEHLVHRIKETSHPYFVYNGVTKVSDDNYIIRFDTKGGGVGALFSTQNQGRINEFVIDVSFCRQAGMLHAFLTSVQSADEGVSWQLQPSLFEGWFAPNQSEKDIAEALLTSMKYF